MKNNILDPGSGTFKPLHVHKRIELIDILRAFALLGIFVVNIQFYRSKPSDTVDVIFNWLIEIFIEGSFYPLFSILFGIGFTIFLSRTQVNGKPNILLFVRRLFILAIIGSLQFILLEPRHILFRYALLGIPLIAFWYASKRVIVWSIGIFLIISLFHSQLIYNLNNWERQLITIEYTLQPEISKESLSTETAVLGINNYAQFSEYVVGNTKLLVPQLINLMRHPSMPHIFASFLFGIFIWRSRIFQRVQKYRTFLRSSFIWCSLFGIIGNIIPLITESNSGLKINTGVIFIIQTLADSLLTISYIAGIAVLTLSHTWSKLINYLVPAGRMGLTNYLLQSLIMSLIFLDYGLNLKDKLDVLECIIIAVMSMIAQIVLSAWWFQRFKFGPIEWIWRVLTYGRWLSIWKGSIPS